MRETSHLPGSEERKRETYHLPGSEERKRETCHQPGSEERMRETSHLPVTLVDLAVYIFVRLVTRGRYAQCHSQFNNLSEF